MDIVENKQSRDYQELRKLSAGQPASGHRPMTPNSLERHFGLLSLPCFLHFHVGRQGTSQEASGSEGFTTRKTQNPIRIRLWGFITIGRVHPLLILLISSGGVNITHTERPRTTGTTSIEVMSRISKHITYSKASPRSVHWTLQPVPTISELEIPFSAPNIGTLSRRLLEGVRCLQIRVPEKA